MGKKSRGEPRIARLIAVGVPFHGSYFALYAFFLILWGLCQVERTWLAIALLMALLWCVGCGASLALSVRGWG